MSEISLDDISTVIVMENSFPWPGVERLQSAGYLGIIFLDVDAISPVEERLFTPREAARASRMGLRRRKGFIAARVALKRLVRQLDLVEKKRPDRAIETLDQDDAKPCLADSGIYCSVSHCARLVVAVAHRHPIGVDLETVSEKTTRTRHLFMSPREEALVSSSGLGLDRAATRAWTIKEAAGKALGLSLFQAIREVEVLKVDEEEGVLGYQGKTYPVRHSEGNGYVITLITCDDL